MPAVICQAPSSAHQGPPTSPHEQSGPARRHSGPNRAGDQPDHYGLRWLFDEDNPEHLPIEKKVLQYKQRDLKQTKLFKTACNVFWTPPSRKRVVIAKSDYTHRKLSIPEAETAPVIHEPVTVSDPVPDPLEYKSWIAERKALRANLNSMGLNEDYLARKPNKTALERSVLRKIIDDRTPKPVPPVIPEDPPYNLKLGDDVPKFRRPCPEAIIVIEEFLTDNKLRLVDLFTNVDKRKNWVVTRQEFTDAVRKAGIPLSEMALEDLIVSLDVDMDNCIDYRELVKGMKDWKLQKKRDKQRLLEEQEALAGQEPSPYVSPADNVRPMTDGGRLSPLSVINELTCDVTAGSMTPPDPHLLSPPPVDTSPDRFDLDSDESMVSLRKRNRETIRQHKKKKRTGLPRTDFYDGRSMIKIGDVSVDNHCRPSTLTGEMGVLVDRFRQDRLREYQEVLSLCQDFDVPLSEKLLTRVLLYPPEKPRTLLKRRIRQPGGALVSLEQVRPAKKTEGKSGTDRRRGGGTGGYAQDEDEEEDYYRSFGGRFRPRKNKPKKVYLSTGKAYIRRKVDCWMTFEEYEKFLSKVEDKRYENGESDESAFWPLQLLDKIRLCMPPYNQPRREPGSSSLFQPVHRTARRAYPGHNNDLNLWPVNGKYLVQGHHDPYKNKY